jgi:hypothetical protein
VVVAPEGDEVEEVAAEADFAPELARGAVVDEQVVAVVRVQLDAGGRLPRPALVSRLYGGCMVALKIS